VCESVVCTCVVSFVQTVVCNNPLTAGYDPGHRREYGVNVSPNVDPFSTQTFSRVRLTIFTEACFYLFHSLPFDEMFRLLSAFSIRRLPLLYSFLFPSPSPCLHSYPPYPLLPFQYILTFSCEIGDLYLFF